MAVDVPRALVEHVLLGPPDDRRQLQDSPILGDVWFAFANQPDQALEVLITPFKTKTARVVALAIEERLARNRRLEDPNVAFLQGVIAAKLYFHEIIRVLVPMTEWWQRKRTQDELLIFQDDQKGPEKHRRVIEHVLGVATRLRSGEWPADTQRQRCSALERFAGLAAVIAWAADQPKRRASRKPAEDAFTEALSTAGTEALSTSLIGLLQAVLNARNEEPLVFQISMNRTASSAIARSVLAVKGDAARTLFNVDCKDIAWAVIDTGIDRTHPAFLSESGDGHRIRRTFDFTQLRQIVSLGNTKRTVRNTNLQLLRARRGETLPEDADAILEQLAQDARQGSGTNWELVEKLVVIEKDSPPPSDHGTHVAGIIGASKDGSKRAAERGNRSALDEHLDGMCPNINLYDFRVLAPNLDDTEFAVVAALQYVRYLNDRHGFITIHGVNLSLSIPHDVRNYACGLTPVCLECERLVESGIVVVAAAGNLGYHSFETRTGSYEGYAALSVTDPGNADGVITVGSTHRFSPHTYGVSFFSSRGPTGDGRLKPDIVAPGERIRGPLPGPEWGDLDGTSMAAPHVSGAAAMLMARYSELIGKPRRIKQILCESATDLGRERNFQGHGMLDVLRAFQSV